jgi:4-carboxymuconolactone decarboxylase
VVSGKRRAPVARHPHETPGDQVHIQRFLAANCFGDRLTRGGLDVATREIVTLSLLVALGGCEAQVASTSSTS